MSDFPSPTLAVEMALKQFGGWFRMFGRSSGTVDIQDITYREGEVGFWVEWSKVKMAEQLDVDVEEACQEFVKAYGRKMPKAELRERMVRALLKNGWKPDSVKVIKEMRTIQKSKREDISCLRKSLRKKMSRRKS